jgi:predicted RNA-binding protein with PIN domain
MSLVIDGYNLMYVAGILGRGTGPGSLQRSRLALLNFLAESIEPRELPRTTVVFDAREAPRGLPRSVQHRGITVRFAAQYAEADDLIEELIAADSAPRRLVVVSSDHRLQRAARRRKAKAVDSDVWYAELVWARRERAELSADVPARPAVPLLEEDVNYWLRQFGGESAFTELLAKETGSVPPAPAKPAERRGKPAEGQGPADNPFPPGYGEDLLENEE